MGKMNRDKTTEIYDKVFNVNENHAGVNKLVKAVIVNFGDERGDIVVYNDNFGTRRKYANFTEGKKKAGLHPMQIVFSGIESAAVRVDAPADGDQAVVYVLLPRLIREAERDAEGHRRC